MANSTTRDFLPGMVSVWRSSTKQPLTSTASSLTSRSPSWHIPDQSFSPFPGPFTTWEAYPHAAPGGLRADPVIRPRRAYPHLPCSKAVAFGLHSYLLLLPSWHTLARHNASWVRNGRRRSQFDLDCARVVTPIRQPTKTLVV